MNNIARVIDSKDRRAVYGFARNVKGADVAALRKVVIDSGVDLNQMKEALDLMRLLLAYRIR